MSNSQAKLAATLASGACNQRMGEIVLQNQGRGLSCDWDTLRGERRLDFRLCSELSWRSLHMSIQGRGTGGAERMLSRFMLISSMISSAEFALVEQGVVRGVVANTLGKILNDRVDSRSGAGLEEAIRDIARKIRETPGPQGWIIRIALEFSGVDPLSLPSLNLSDSLYVPSHHGDGDCISLVGIEATGLSFLGGTPRQALSGCAIWPISRVPGSGFHQITGEWGTCCMALHQTRVAHHRKLFCWWWRW